jgi:anti-sigma factor RsiW
MSRTIPPEALSAFIDGELPPAEAASIAASLRDDPALAAQAQAFRRDRDLLRAAFAPVAAEALPAAWLARIEAAAAPRDAVPAGEVAPDNVIAFRKRPAAPGPWQKARPLARRAAPWAAAACLVLALSVPGIRHFVWPTGDTILQVADAARSGTLPALASLDGAAIPDAQAQRALLRKATGLPVHAPDLRRLGWSLAGLRIYRGAAQLQYRNGSGEPLTLFVRASDGAPRFDLLRHGALRVCVWQDDVVGTVIMGTMSAGQMDRVAAAAYDDLSSS